MSLAVLALEHGIELDGSVFLGKEKDFAVHMEECKGERTPSGLSRRVFMGP